MAEAERLCPKCPFTVLESQTVKSLQLDECPTCRGRWYDVGELVGTVERPQELRQAMSSGPLKPRPSEALCPCCRGNMVNGGLVNELLRVDLCPACKGFWLDRNEIPLVDKLLAAC